MALFEENAEDRIGVSQASVGPRLGFLDAMATSYEAQKRSDSLFGLDYAVRDAEQEQVTRLKRAGVSPPKSLNDEEDEAGTYLGSALRGGRLYRSMARFYEDGTDEGPEADPISMRLNRKNKEIAELKAKHPDLGIKDYSELWADTKARTQRLEKLSADSPTTIGGTIGGFAGAAVAGVNPVVNPLNFATLPIGGGGGTVAARIGIQAAIQGGVQGGNELLGVQEQRRLQGLENGLGQALTNIAGAALGGAALQGLAEGVGFLGRRWFRNAPNDPAPPAPIPPERPVNEMATPRQAPDIRQDFSAFMDRLHETAPLGQSRIARARTVLDADHVQAQLDDFHGPMPWEVKPPTETAPTPYPTRSTYDRPYTKVVDGMESVDDVARRVDPETFRVYDKLQEQIAAARAEIVEHVARPEVEGVRQAREDAPAMAATIDLDAQISALEKRVERASGKNKGRFQERLDDMIAMREAATGPGVTPDSVRIVEVRARLAELDEQARDLAPVVSRAYAAAKGEWQTADMMDIDALRFLKSREIGSFRFRPDEFPTRSAAAPEIQPPTLNDRLPALNEPAARALPNGDAADKMAAVRAVADKAMDEATDRFRETVGRLIEADDKGPARYVIGNREIPADRTITVEGPNGEAKEMPLRQFMKSVERDEQAHKAMTTCSTSS